MDFIEGAGDLDQSQRPASMCHRTPGTRLTSLSDSMPSFSTPAPTASLINFDVRCLADGVLVCESAVDVTVHPPSLHSDTPVTPRPASGFPPIEVSHGSEFVGLSVFARRKARADNLYLGACIYGTDGEGDEVGNW